MENHSQLQFNLCLQNFNTISARSRWLEYCNFFKWNKKKKKKHFQATSLSYYMGVPGFRCLLPSAATRPRDSTTKTNHSSHLTQIFSRYLNHLGRELKIENTIHAIILLPSSLCTEYIRFVKANKNKSFYWHFNYFILFFFLKCYKTKYLRLALCLRVCNCFKEWTTLKDC